ncbi:MAG: AraC family transcriptional regulator [Clostridia bacterium]|nr:AraC family transcriptional regulator [Clostridia bacterium]
MIRSHKFTGKTETTVRYCEEEKNLKPGARYGPIIRDIYIVECCTSGYGTVVINGKEFAVTPGSCYVLFPGDTVIHTADRKEPRKGFWCAIDGLSVGKYFALAGIRSDAPFAPPALFEELSLQMRRMVEIWKTDSAATAPLVTACIYNFFGILLRGKSAPGGGEEWVERAIGLMESRFHEPLTVAEVAAEIGLERAYFSTLFKEKTGSSPHRFLTGLRIRKACELFPSGMSVTEIALSVGLDPRNFSRLFKKETGKTPLEYKSKLPR